MTHSVLGGHLLRARVTVEEKNSVVFTSALVRIVPHCTDLLQKIVTHSVLGGHFIRARVTAEKDSVVFKSALVRILPH